MVVSLYGVFADYLHPCFVTRLLVGGPKTLKGKGSVLSSSHESRGPYAPTFHGNPLEQDVGQWGAVDWVRRPLSSGRQSLKEDVGSWR